ncbi:MAG: hypothetical protein EWM72_02777 [Nitrospira sp.]|nr:MAG: hypothetical protein EWM72_02777 [Nitrospira sp.]
MLLEEGFYSCLSTAPTVAALIGTRLYPVFLPQGVAVPAVTYRRARSDVTQTLEEEGLRSATMEVIVWDDDYVRAKRAAQTIHDVLVAVTATLGGLPIHGITRENEEDVFDEESRAAGLLGVRQEFEIIVDP